MLNISKPNACKAIKMAKKIKTTSSLSPSCHEKTFTIMEYANKSIVFTPGIDFKMGIG